MKRPLYRKFILTYIILGVASFLLIATLGSRLIEDHLMNSNSRSLYNEATAISAALSSQTYLEQSSLERTYYNLHAVGAYQDARIMIINSQNEILLDTGVSFAQTEQPPVLTGFNPASFGAGYYHTGKFFDCFEEEHLNIIVPIIRDLYPSGYVTMHLPLSEVYAEREALLLKVYLLAGIIFLMFLIILGLLSFRVYRPLKKITEGAKEYANGNLTHSIPVNSNDEMGYLATTLNYMAQELNKTGEYQKKFIANVSHDFRSPLTSIKGYVEAIQDGTIPPEIQGKYLDIVLFETERLNKLTRSLLTLNNINDAGKTLDISSFDINAVIKNTAATFEGICREKQLSISLVLSSRTQFVTADIGKIQQVLYNLIDNAIKFSPHNSTIVVETTEKHGKVFISVKDSGIGIAKENLNRIWERFYKIDSSRGKDRKGTGLGLAIVKEIITAHNQNINVVSTPDVGTEFIFTLDAEKKPDQS